MDEPTSVLPHVLLGSKAHARDRELLERLRVTHVLNVTPPKTTDPVAGVPNFFDKDKRLTYRRCAIFDNAAEDILGVLEGCVAFIEQAKFYGRILVHCNKGVSRSPSVVIAYLIKAEGMSFDDALRFLVAKRPVVKPNEGFCRQLQQYERRLRRPEATKQRGARRPVGPALPPHLAAPQHEEQSSKKDVESIGPQLPPHLRSQAADVQKETEDKAPACSIGPTLPPNLRKQQVGKEETANEEKPARGEVIGPSLPPHLRQKRQRSPSAERQSAKKTKEDSE